MSIDDELLRQQAEEDSQKEQAEDKLGSQFKAGGSENRPKNKFSGPTRLDYHFGDEVAGELVVEARQWFKCYHCNHFQTDNEKDYESHMVDKHYRLPAYPTKD